MTRRIYCACGCGAWFYWETAFHRPPAYLTAEHYARERTRRRKLRAAIRRAQQSDLDDPSQKR